MEMAYQIQERIELFIVADMTVMDDTEAQTYALLMRTLRRDIEHFVAKWVPGSTVIFWLPGLSAEVKTLNPCAFLKADDQLGEEVPSA